MPSTAPRAGHRLGVTFPWLLGALLPSWRFLRASPEAVPSFFIPLGPGKPPQKQQEFKKKLRKELGPRLCALEEPPEQWDVSCSVPLGWGWALPVGQCF